MSSRDSEEVSFILKDPPRSYLLLRVTGYGHQDSSTSISQPSLDEITVRQLLMQAMTQYLGLTGSAVLIDVLKVDNQDAWVRLAHEDEEALITSLSQWSGKGVTLTIRASSSWLATLVAKKQAKEMWTMSV